MVDLPDLGDQLVLPEGHDIADLDRASTLEGHVGHRCLALGVRALKHVGDGRLQRTLGLCELAPDLLELLGSRVGVIERTADLVQGRGVAVHRRDRTNITFGNGIDVLLRLVGSRARERRAGQEGKREGGSSEGLDGYVLQWVVYRPRLERRPTAQVIPRRGSPFCDRADRA